MPAEAAGGAPDTTWPLITPEAARAVRGCAGRRAFRASRGTPVPARLAFARLRASWRDDSAGAGCSGRSEAGDTRLRRWAGGGSSIPAAASLRRSRLARDAIAFASRHGSQRQPR